MIPSKKVRAIGWLSLCVILLVVLFKSLDISSIPKSPPESSATVNTPTQPLSTDPSFYPSGASSTQENALPKSIVAVIPPPRITAHAYLAGNVTTGKVYESYNPGVALPVASMSKLITALASLNLFRADARITITPLEALAPPDGSMLVAGETYTVQELLYPLLLDSSNVAAEALASSTDRAHFLEIMSSYAWEIGMPSSFFADPSGVDPRNKASAKDLFVLARYLIKYHPDILELTRTPLATTATTSDHGTHVFASIHPFVKDPNFLGGKTGRTPQAGETMLTIINIKGQPVAIIVLDSAYGMREKDTREIMADVASSL